LTNFRSTYKSGNIRRMENDSTAGFSAGWRLSGYVFLGLAAIFVFRIVYEETVLTWLNGSQMVGFALVHALITLYLLTFVIGLGGGLLWVVASLIPVIHRKFRIPLVDWIPFVLLLALTGLLTISQGTWVERMLRIAGRSPCEYIFMADAAAEGNQRLVNYILDKGYDIEGGGHVSPLSAAAVDGRNEMVVFLISRGADVNRRWERTQNTPLMDAAEMGHLDTVKALIE
jgi:hypothetical protein